MATYLILNIIFVAVLAVLLGRRVKTAKPWWLMLVGLLILTIIFDNVIIGLGIVGYNAPQILGIKIGLAPIEDFFYILGTAIIVPALWNQGETHE